MIATFVITEAWFAAPGEPGGEWQLKCHEGVTMTPVADDAVTLRLCIANTSGANWHGELQCSPFPVMAGETRHLVFSARAEHPFAFSVWLGEAEPPHESLVSPQNHFGEAVATGEWQTFSHRWVLARTEDQARLVFAIGCIDNTFEIRDMRLTLVLD